MAVLEFFSNSTSGGAVAQLGARLDGIEEVVGSNPIGSTIRSPMFFVYILQSESGGRYRVGQTENLAGQSNE